MSTQQETITFVNIYAANIGAPKYVKQVLIDLMGGIGNNIITAGGSISHFQQLIDNSDRKSIKNIGLKLHMRSDELDRYLQNIPSNRSKI